MTSWDQLEAEALDLVPAAAAGGVTLRVVGSAGIRLHCAGPAGLMDALGRPAKDIDFVVPQGHRKGMRRFLEARGYVIDRDLLIAMEGRRYSFSHPGTGVDIDVFVERMEFCHTVEVAGRMDKHPMTICPDDLLLAAIDAEPKTRGWRLRDRIGERKQWWQDVDEKEATY